MQRNVDEKKKMLFTLRLTANFLELRYIAFEYLSAVAWKGGRTDVMFDLDAQVVLHPSETDRLRRSFCAKGEPLHRA